MNLTPWYRQAPVPASRRAGNPVAVALALGVLLGGSGACHRARQPVTLPIPAVTQIAIPLPLVPRDEALFGYVRVRDPLKLAQGLVGDRLETLAHGLPLQELRPGSGSAVFLWDPAGQPWAAMPVAAVLPVSPAGALAGRLTRALGEGLVRADGAGIQAALNPTGQARATAAGPALWQVAESKDAGDLLLYLNVAGMLDRYGPQARTALRSLGALGALSPSSPPMAGQPSTKASMALLERLLDRLQALRGASLSLSLTPDVLELASVTEQRAPTAGAGPLGAPDLASLLPAAEVRFQWNARDLKRWTHDYLDLYGALWAEQPALQAQIRGTLEEWARVSPQAQMAGAIALRPTLRLHTIIKVHNAAEALAVIRKNAAQWATGPAQERTRQQGLTIGIKVDVAARRLHGWPVDHYLYQVAISDPSKLPAQTRALIEKMNGLTYEVMQLGPYILASVNEPLDALANSVLTGRGAGPLRASRLYPAGATSYADLDVGGLWSAVKAFLPPAQASRLADPPAGLGIATWFSHEGEGAALYRLQLPRAVLELLGGKRTP